MCLSRLCCVLQVLVLCINAVHDCIALSLLKYLAKAIITFLETKMGLCHMATLGKIGEFNVTKEEWTQFVEQLDYFFVANMA